MVERIIYDDDECYDDETEILTRKGFKYFNEVISKEILVATLNPETEKLEYHKPTHFFSKMYRGKMYHFGGKYHKYDLLTSPKHEHWVREYRHPERGWFKVTSEKLAKLLDGGRELEFKKDTDWDGDKLEVFELGDKEFPIEDWLKFTAWYLAEGCPNGKYITNINQRKEKFKNDIKGVLRKLALSWGEDKDIFYVYGKWLNEYFRQFGKSYEKYIPEYIKKLSPRLIEIFIREYAKGDGTGDLRDINTTSPKMRDDLQELILKMGLSSTVHTSNNSSGYGTGEVPLYKITINHKQNTPMMNTNYKVIDYKGMIYDLTVENHLIYIRRNGKTVWSGNSFWSIYTSGAGAIGLTVSEETSEVQEGISSLKMVVGAGTDNSVGVRHTYASAQDWSHLNSFSFWWYGANTNESIELRLWHSDTSKGYYWYDWIENWSGWQQITIPRSSFNESKNTVSWQYIKIIDFTSINNVGTRYLDYVVLDLGESLTLENDNRFITLDYVTSYQIIKNVKYAVKKVPTRSGAIVDTQTVISKPRVYRIQARVDRGLRDDLLSLESDRLAIRLNDGNITDNACVLNQGPNFTYQTGRNRDGVGGSRPWMVRLSLLSSAN